MRIEGGRRVSRRLVLAGGAAGVMLCAIPKQAASLELPESIIWRGQAMGAPAKIILYHSDRPTAERLLRESALEAERLENIFSLYRAESELAKLNRNGALASPSPDLVEVLRICHKCWQASDGLFDPTVQPLWNCLKKHFSQEHSSPDGPSRQLWDEALARVGFGYVLFDDNRIAFTKSSMSLTLNGIAQGYVTDRVTALLQTAGAEHALVDMGSIALSVQDLTARHGALASPIWKPELLPKSMLISAIRRSQHPVSLDFSSRSPDGLTICSTQNRIFSGTLSPGDRSSPRCSTS